jgi:tetratricopeptide (TPR) repeat protein
LLLLGLALPGGAVPRAAADDDGAFSASRTVLVIGGDAEVFLGNKSVAKIGPGTVLRYTKESGPWLLIPQHNAWLKRDQAVPIEGAVRHFDELIRKRPTPQAYHHRGIARLALRDPRGALADFNQAIAAGLKEPGVYINRGVAHERAGDLQAALKDSSQAIELDPANARAYDNRSGVLAALGQYDASLVDSNRAIDIDPGFAEAWNNAGVTRRLKREYPKAVANYTRAIEIEPDYAAAYANRGFAHKQLGRLAEAVADYTQAIRLDAEAPGAHNDFAWMLAVCRDEAFRDAEAAVQHAQRACEISEFKNADYLDTLAAALAASGDFERAAEFARKARDIAKEDARPPIERRLALYESAQPYQEE